MARHIDAEKLKEKMKAWFVSVADDEPLVGVNEIIYDFICAIDEEQSVDVQPVKYGEWKTSDTPPTKRCFCSECGALIETTHYCWHCYHNYCSYCGFKNR